jgi:hypothetical protein
MAVMFLLRFNAILGFDRAIRAASVLKKIDRSGCRAFEQRIAVFRINIITDLYVFRRVMEVIL